MENESSFEISPQVNPRINNQSKKLHHALKKSKKLIFCFSILLFVVLFL